jgi:hypothetical protein
LAIKFISGTEDVPKPLVNLTIDDPSAESWWGGVFRSGVSLALATVAAAAVLSTAVAIQTASQPQDDPTGNLYNPIEEVYWQNPTAPVPASLGSLYLPDPEQVPAGSLYGTYDEVYWQNPVPPVPASFGPLYLPDATDVPAGKLANFFTDEDFWVNPVQPVQASFGNLYSYDDAVWVAPALSFQPDEDYWVSPPPQQASLLPFQTWQQDEVPYLVADEDFWANPVQPVPATFAALYVFDSGEWVTPPAAPSFDEDYWQNPIFPTQMSVYFTLPLGDHDEIPAGSLTTPPPPPTGKPNSIRMGIFNV